MSLSSNGRAYEKQGSLGHYVSTLALPPSFGLTTSLPQGPSRLKHLSIDRLCLTHDSLGRNSPSMPQVVRAQTGQHGRCRISNRVLQHTGVKMFWSPLKSVFPSWSRGSSLLSLLPSLTLLYMLGFDPAFTVSSRTIKELPRFCPLLNGYQLEGHSGAIFPSSSRTDLPATVATITFPRSRSSTST